MKINNELLQTARQLIKQLHQGQKADLKQSEVERTSTDLTHGYSDAVKTGVKMLKDAGLPITTESVEQVKNFLETGPGLVSEKLAALSVLIEKGMPLSQGLAQDIHTARTVTLADFLVPAKAVERSSTRHETQTSPIKENAKPHINQASLTLVDALFEEIVLAYDQKNQKTIQPLSSEQPSQNKTLHAPQQEAVDKVHFIVNDVDNIPNKTHLPTSNQANVPQTIHKTHTEGFQALQPEDDTQKHENEPLMDHPQETLDLMLSFLQTVSQDIEKFSLIETASQSSSRVLQEPRVKLMLEETVTPRLLAIKASFDAFKTTTHQALKPLLDVSQPLDPASKVAALSKIIDQMDNMIMKSEVGLYVSMKNERNLLRQSSTLEEARQLLIKGDTDQALAKVQEVKTNIDQMTFKPTLKRVVGFMSESQNFSLKEVTYERVQSFFEDQVGDFSKEDKSVAGLVHYLRRLGVNHETEVFQETYRPRDSESDKWVRSPLNLKSLLLKLSEGGKEDTQGERISKALSHINGQQMNLKLLDKQQQQPLMLNIPMSMNGMIKDVKVFIKSQQDQMKVDWKNFSMFFVLKTEQFGEVGIKTSAVDKKMRIDIYNDHPKIENKAKPLAEVLEKYVEEVGFVVTHVRFTAWGKEHPNQVSTQKTYERPKPFTPDGRMDVKI